MYFNVTDQTVISWKTKRTTKKPIILNLSMSGGDLEKRNMFRFHTHMAELHESICAVPVWQYGPSICTYGHEAI